MAGSATIGSSLMDEMIGLVDELRTDLHPGFGMRQFNVYTVLRTWAFEIGDVDGGYTDTETLLEPQPKVQPYRVHFNLEPCGIDEAGYVKLTEVSLTYTEAELTGNYGVGASLTNNQEWLYKLADAQGQAIEDTYWVLTERPFPDRDTIVNNRGYGTIGWHVKLRRAGSTA